MSSVAAGVWVHVEFLELVQKERTGCKTSVYKMNPADCDDPLTLPLKPSGCGVNTVKLLLPFGTLGLGLNWHHHGNIALLS